MSNNRIIALRSGIEDVRKEWKRVSAIQIIEQLPEQETGNHNSDLLFGPRVGHLDRRGLLIKPGNDAVHQPDEIRNCFTQLSVGFYDLINDSAHRPETAPCRDGAGTRESVAGRAENPMVDCKSGSAWTCQCCVGPAQSHPQSRASP